jgi:disulfide bond formation protein DsbB
MPRSLSVILNTLGLFGIALTLAAAFTIQLMRGELPCPLCLLQRILFAMLAVGPILNIRFGARPAHYALSLLAAVVGAAVAARQILLHIMPGDPGYGSALLGYHYYTWAFIVFVAAIVLIGIVLLFDTDSGGDRPAPPAGPAARAAVWLVIGLAGLNVVSTLVECGFAACPDNPTFYQLLQRKP